MTAQETANRFAALAGPRFASLVRMSTARHIYDTAPGSVNSEFIEAGIPIKLDRWKRNLQPYKDLERFVSDERVMSSVIDPGLLPIAKAISTDVRGCRLLVTRRIGALRSDNGVTAHVEGLGIRILIRFDDGTAETIVTWECLYGVA